jgi:hypothetical protein
MGQEQSNLMCNFYRITLKKGANTGLAGLVPYG